VFEIIARVGARPNHAPRHTHYRGVLRHRADHHRAGPDLGMIADRNVAEDFRTRADHDVVSDSRMPLALLFARSTQCHALIKQRVVADLGGLTDHHAHAVIDKTPASDGGPRMDLDPSDTSIELRKDSRQQREAIGVQPVSRAMQQDGMKAGVTEKDFQRALGGWITVEDGFDLFPDGPKHTTWV
jgi:hypothetical protein